MDTNRRSDFGSSIARRGTPAGSCSAFTLTELLVVLATVGILALVVLPALAGTQPGSAKVIQCLNNMRQMAVAWTLYAEDNHDRLVNNFDITGTQAEISSKNYRNWSNDVLGWGNTPSITNLDGIRLAPFYQYTMSLVIYRCPADQYLSALQMAIGWTARPRSYSMNCFLGPTSLNWTSDGNGFFPNYRQFLKTSAIPAPYNLYALLEEHPDSINDGYFNNDPSPAIQKWSDLPGSFHAGACSFAFADGHSEIHQWKSRVCTILPVRFTTFATPNFIADTSGAGLRDGQWLASHSSVLR